MLLQAKPFPLITASCKSLLLVVF